MFNVVYEILLVIVFFVIFKLYDIYVATIVIIVGSALQIIGTRYWLKRFDKKQCLVFLILIVFGGMTLYFHNPIFIKWKPTVLFWLMGVVFLIGPHFSKKPFTQYMMSHALEGKPSIPVRIWKRLDLAWSIFFISLGTVNLAVAYYCTTDAWVNFKVYGILGSLIIFGFIQSFFLARYLVAVGHENH